MLIQIWFLLKPFNMIVLKNGDFLVQHRKFVPSVNEISLSDLSNRSEKIREGYSD